MLNLIKEGELVARFPPDALVVFVDETGHERFADPEYPVFGLGGCATFVAKYGEVVRDPWEEMRAQHFEGESLHASEMHDASQEQLEAIGTFFREQEFIRIAVTLAAETEIPDGVESYQLTAPALLNRLSDFGFSPVPSSVVLILEESQRTRGIAERHFSGYHLEAPYGEARRQIDLERYFMPKSAEEAGLEVADFIMHAAGTQRRVGVVGDDTRVRKDYDVVFRAVDDRLVSIFNITRASED